MMNDVYFGCLDCKEYVDAGYRWAYWELEKKGVVNETDAVSVAAVLAARSYWEPTRNSGTEWLYQEIFPSVKSFLQKHAVHHVVYGDEERLLRFEDDGAFLDWLQVGFLAKLSPRSLVEQGFQSWEEVQKHVSSTSLEPWWWHEPTLHRRAREKFEALTQGLAQQPG